MVVSTYPFSDIRRRFPPRNGVDKMPICIFESTVGRLVHSPSSATVGDLIIPFRHNFKYQLGEFWFS